MKLLLSNTLALQALGFAIMNTSPNDLDLRSLLVARGCCRDGCYSVKGEAYVHADCKDFDNKASIANYGSHGACVGIANDASIKSYNDGCPSSHVDLHFFKEAGCPGGASGGFITIRTDGGKKCTPKPKGAVAFIAVSN